MKIETTETAWTSDNPCAIVIVKNESYANSLRLLREDIEASNSRAIYLTVGESDVFADYSSSDVLHTNIQLPVGESNTNRYGIAVLNAFRMRPDIVISELFENHPTVTLNGEPIYPLDDMFLEAMRGISTAIVVEAETVKESLRSVYPVLHEVGQKFFFSALALVYMDGKRWVITPDIILDALQDTQ